MKDLYRINLLKYLDIKNLICKYFNMKKIYINI